MYTPISRNVALTGDVSNTDRLITKQCSAGKSQGLAVMWVGLDTDYPSKHRCGQSTPPHDKDTLPLYLG